MIQSNCTSMQSKCAIMILICSCEETKFVSVSLSPTQPMKPMGLFALLDDEVKIPRGTDLGFVDKLTKGFPNMSDFKRSKGQQLEFTIQHFAGQVSK